MARAAERYGALSALRLRFRSPLRPSTPARVTGVVAGRSGVGADVDLVLESDEQRLVTGRASVTQ